MKKIIYTAFLLLFIFNGVNAQNKIQRKIYKNFAKMLKKDDVQNGFLQIRSADGALDWKFIEGTFQDGSKVSEANPFHSTSVGKMFTATLIMKLAEEAKLNLSDSLSEHLPSEIISGLHIYDGKDNSQKITVAQLLQHTSGLPDYIEDMPEDGSPNMMSLALQNPDKFWKVEELLAFSKEKLEAHFLPGEAYHYTDTEYLLLGLIIEEKYQKELHQVFLEEFFEPLEMKSTSMFKRSKPVEKTARMAELYVNKTEISQYNSVSIDWAGGGLVTTTEDLLKFHQALFSGKIISESSLKKMQNWKKESKGIYYGLGLRKFDLDEFFMLLPKITIVGHSGLSSAFSFYCPELKIYMTGTFNQTNQMKNAIKFIIKNLIIIKKYSL